KVVNLMGVRGPEQVMLSVHVAEVQRSALRQLGITQIQGAWSDAGAIALPELILNPDALVNMGLSTMIGRNVTLQGLFNALETKGYASMLAEPTLTALSGETAVFFAGGEFPVPVPQLQGGGQALITIDYKQYGVSVGFTPTVYGDTINLLVSPEVSALDKENSVVLQGFRIPGITTRRAKTTVELKNGQSFAIAGLIRRDFSDSLRGIPGAASLPLFGALFRSTAYQNNETEVVIIVTAHLAKPTDRTNLLLPTDTREAPSVGELLLTNTVDKPRAPARAGSAPGQGPMQ
ncbi:MAG: pilus assembly protein CpaC, partial [Phenylobacterium sp.]|nr:pilus assembly protein CpaC [Phenylobacterium sp.]